MKVSRELKKLRSEVGELQAVHEGSSLDEFAAYRDDPVGFICETLGERDPGPWSVQEAVARAVVDHPLVRVQSCNGLGKDWLAARLALWWVYARRGQVLITGPTERQVKEILMMGELARAFHRTRRLGGELYQLALRLPGHAQTGILAFTSSEVSRLTGFHAPRTLVIVTEAQGVEDYAWEGLLSCATAEDDRVAVFGNPLVPTGRFFTTSNMAHWRSFKVSALEHPNVVEDREVIPGAVTRRFIETIRREYGEDSPQYVARVLGQFPETATDSLVRQAWLGGSTKAHADGRFADSEYRYTIGVDVARFGPDASVACIRRGPHVIGFREWKGLDTQEVARRVLALLRDLHAPTSPVARVVVDVVGIGSGVYDKLAEDLADEELASWYEQGRAGRMHERSTSLVEFNGGMKAKDPEKFLNLRAETFWHVRKLLEDGEVALPDDEALLKELRLTRYEFNAKGKTGIEAKEKLKARLGNSPDRADALSMSFVTETEQPAGTAVRWSTR